MVEKNNPHIRFPGTYFSHDDVLRLSIIARVGAWIAISVYFLDWLVDIGVYIMQVTRGFWAGVGFSEHLLRIIPALQKPVQGIVYFVILYSVSKFLLIMLDIEDNSRKSARSLMSGSRAKEK